MATEKNEKQMDVSMSIKLPKDLRDRVSAKSDETGISASFVMRKALEDWVSQVKEFVVCVQDPNYESNDNTVLLHPAVRVFNGNPEKYTSPREVIRTMQETYEGKRVVAVDRSTVSESTWDWLISELRTSTEQKLGWAVDRNILIVE